MLFYRALRVCHKFANKLHSIFLVVACSTNVQGVTWYYITVLAGFVEDIFFGHKGGGLNCTDCLPALGCRQQEGNDFCAPAYELRNMIDCISKTAQ